MGYRFVNRLLRCTAVQHVSIVRFDRKFENRVGKLMRSTAFSMRFQSELNDDKYATGSVYVSDYKLIIFRG